MCLRSYLKPHECFEGSLPQSDPTWRLAVWQKLGASANFSIFSPNFGPNLHLKLFKNHLLHLLGANYTKMTAIVEFIIALITTISSKPFGFLVNFKKSH